MKRFLKILGLVLLILVLALAALVLWLTVREYKPEAVEQLEVSSVDEPEEASLDSELNILSWNIGYAGLGAESDFFMDGGEDSRSADEEQVLEYLSGIRESLDATEVDLAMLQEVDIDSGRTYRIDERDYLSLGSGVHALNYACDFVPIPLPPLGRIYSGIYTTAPSLDISDSRRVSLPCPFSWPVSTANLKRCLLVSYIPIEGSDKELVTVNLHLEAYDDGEGKIAQTNMLKSIIEGEYEKGNYVIAGGDFNQIFPGGLEAWPNTHPENWMPGVLEEDMLEEGWSFAYDLDVPSCRLLNQPYDPEDTENTQYYVIDGFIISPNVELVEVETLDLGFEDSDHNPVVLTVSLAQ